MKKCLYCKEVFPTPLELLYHEEDDHGAVVPQHCNVCHKHFTSKSACMRHQQKKHETKNLGGFLNERYGTIAIEPSSRKVARYEVERVFEAVKQCLGDGIFSKNFRKSGSYSTDTKVLNADEFDFDIPLRFSLEELHLNREGNRVYYDFTQRQKTLNLNVPMRVVTTRSWDGIPQGYVEVKTTSGRTIVPRIIQEELYRHLKCAQARMQDTIDVRNEAKGLALPITIKRKHFPTITVDLCASMAINQITLSDYKWPRSETKVVLPRFLIKSIYDAGLHLIPKDIKFWYISVSRAGQALMNGIDDNDHGCRKMCHKLLKADFQTWLGRSGNNLPGISSMIFKVRRLLFVYLNFG